MKQHTRHPPLERLLHEAEDEAEQERREQSRDARSIEVSVVESPSGLQATVTVSGDVAPGADLHPVFRSDAARHLRSLVINGHRGRADVVDLIGRHSLPALREVSVTIFTFGGGLELTHPRADS